MFILVIISSFRTVREYILNEDYKILIRILLKLICELDRRVCRIVFIINDYSIGYEKPNKWVAQEQQDVLMCSEYYDPGEYF